MTHKKSFILYFDCKKQIDMLSDEQAGKLFKGLFEFAVFGKSPEFSDGMLNMAFSFISAQIERDTAKYQETCMKRSENAKKQWNKLKNASACKSMQKDEFTGDNVNENENENDNENDTDTFFPDKFGNIQQHNTFFSEKISFGEYHHIKLTQKEYDNLCNDYSENTVREYIRKIDEWLQLNGNKTYNDFNLAIRKWLDGDNIRKVNEKDDEMRFMSSDPNDAPF